MDRKEILQVNNLSTCFELPHGRLYAVNKVSFSLFQGENLGIVGESGSGKSVTANSILRLIKKPGRIFEGEILYDGQDILKMDDAELGRLRGSQISMIFQDPLSALNPSFTVGWQIGEAYRLHHPGATQQQIREHTIEMLEKVKIPNARLRVNDYPHQFSGGMRQRVLIAIALACTPRILIADEPTTALDVTVQSDIMDILDELREQLDLSLLFISHNLNLVGERCSRIVVMYAGEVIEIAPSENLFENPAHPYTQGLLGAIPNKERLTQRLTPIPGNVPSVMSIEPGCVFAPRCKHASERCRRETPKIREVSAGHYSKCHFAAGEEENDV